MKLAILGGSFNPVHIGHLILAETVLLEFEYDRVILIPTYQSPFKIDAQGGSPKDRMDMLTASIAGDPHFTVEDTEIKRKGISYTIDTIKDIINRYHPTGKPALILGDDLICDFNKWKSAEEIAELADIIIANRIPSGSMDFPYPHRRLNNTIIEISSEYIRDQIKNQGIWRYLVPQSACKIIEERRLYDYKPRYNKESALETLILRIENTVHNSVNASRFVHSRNVALLSWDLCKRFGLDPLKGYLAGISHDICKSMDDEDIIMFAKKDGQDISKQEKKKPSLLHGRAGAIFVQEKFGINDDAIIEAIRLHTVGDENMGDLAKVVYIADKIEVSRHDVDPELRRLSRTAGLEELFSIVLDKTVEYLRSSQTDISPSTLNLLNAMQRRVRL